LWENQMDWRCSWLYTPRNDGKPRMLITYSKYSTFNVIIDCASFIERFKKVILHFKS
jgi:hypothetical protein